MCLSIYQKIESSIPEADKIKKWVVIGAQICLFSFGSESGSRAELLEVLELYREFTLHTSVLCVRAPESLYFKSKKLERK